MKSSFLPSILMALICIRGADLQAVPKTVDDPMLQTIESKLQRIETILPWAAKEQKLLPTPLDLLLDNCDAASAIFMECDIPRDLTLASLKLPTEFWNSKSYFELTSRMFHMETNLPFTLIGPLNGCQVKPDVVASKSICYLGDAGAAVGEKTLELKLGVPPLPKSAASNRDLIYIDAVAELGSLTFYADPVVLIINLKELGGDLLKTIDSTMIELKKFDGSNDVRLFENSTLKILYNNSVNTESVCLEDEVCLAADRSKPLLGYPNNKIKGADGKEWIGKCGDGVLDADGIPTGEYFSGHSPQHCNQLYYITRLMCIRGAGVVVDPVTFAASDICRGLQNFSLADLTVERSAIEAKVDRIGTAIDRMTIIADVIKDRILSEYVVKIDSELTTYLNEYVIYRAIRQYEAEKKQVLSGDDWLSKLKAPRNPSSSDGYLASNFAAVDAWGTAFVLSREGSHAVVLTSSGPDKVSGPASTDDLVYENGERR